MTFLRLIHALGLAVYERVDRARHDLAHWVEEALRRPVTTSGQPWSPAMCPGDTDFCPYNGCTTCQGPLFHFSDPDKGAGKIPESDHDAWARLVAERERRRTE